MGGCRARLVLRKALLQRLLCRIDRPCLRPQRRQQAGGDGGHAGVHLGSVGSHLLGRPLALQHPLLRRQLKPRQTCPGRIGPRYLTGPALLPL